MTFTSTLLAVLAGIAIWQLIIFIGFSCGLEDNDYFLYFITCFYAVPALILLTLIRKLKRRHNVKINNSLKKRD